MRNVPNRANAGLQEHERDAYVKRAREEGYRSRAVFKLEEIQRTDRILRSGITIVDLGGGPRRLLRGECRIIAVDILRMDETVGVEFLHGDFSQNVVLTELTGLLGDVKVDLVLSDIWRETCQESLMSITIDLCM